MNHRTTPSFRPVALVALALVLPAGCSTSPEPVEHVARATQAIQGGETATSQNYAVGVCAGSSYVGCAFRCSGTLIAPNLVATVRHCIAEAPRTGVNCSRDQFGRPLSEPGQLWVTTNQNLGVLSGGWHRVRRFLFPDTPWVCGGDIALLVLEENIPPSEASPATPEIRTSLNEPSYLSTTVTQIGYGESSLEAGDYGTRNIRQSNLITCIPGRSGLECPNLMGSVIDPKEFVVGGGGCPGDSGSSAFEQVEYNAGRAVSIGILARSFEGSCMNGIYTRFDSWATFVASSGKLAAQLGQYEVPAWANIPTSELPDDPNNPFKPGDLGGPCTRSDQCTTGVCASVNLGRSWVCSQTCTPATPGSCPADFECRSNGAGGGLCFVAPPPPGDDSCAAAPGPAHSSTSAYVTLGIALAARIIRRRKHARARRHTS